MAIIKFESEPSNTGSEKPWVDDYYNQLTPSKQKKFLATFFTVERGNEAGKKGWICETSEFKVWVWMDSVQALNEAATHAEVHEVSLLVSFTVNRNGRLKPEFAVDSEIPALYKRSSKGFFQNVTF